MSDQVGALLNYGDGPRAVFDHLSARILTGKLAPGSELKIANMAQELGVSIAPIREAVRMLAAEGLIELRPRRSPIIAELNRDDLREINGIRLALEPDILEDAIPRHTEASLKLCEEILKQDEAAISVWERADLNQRFHMALLDPSSLKRSISIVRDQYVGMTRILHCRLITHLEDNPEQFYRHRAEHERLFKAVTEKRTEDARAHLIAHIELATNRAFSLFSGQPAS